jgi:isopenicillin N synthase-like dioxygenase
MDVSKDDCTNQLRMLYYPEVENSAGGWRHGNHTDIGCLTLVFQRDGEDGLEVMPGRKTHTSAIHGDDFFPIPAKMGPIVVNIGDMLSEF